MSTDADAVCYSTQQQFNTHLNTSMPNQPGAIILSAK